MVPPELALVSPPEKEHWPTMHCCVEVQALQALPLAPQCAGEAAWQVPVASQQPEQLPGPQFDALQPARPLASAARLRAMSKRCTSTARRR